MIAALAAIIALSSFAQDPAAPPLVYGRGPAQYNAPLEAPASGENGRRPGPAQYSAPDTASSVLDPGELLRDAPRSKPEPAKEPESENDGLPGDASLPIVREGRAGWVKTPASLLLYDSSGTLVNEVGLGTWDEPASEGTVLRRTVRGGISRDGRFAWSWELALTVKPGRAEKPLATARLMRYLGTDGQELFRNELADAPKGLEPVLASDNGERLLLAEHGPDAWILAAYDFTGNRLVDTRGKGSIEQAELTKNGRFALVCWHQLDRAPEYAFLNIEDRSTAPLPELDATGTLPTLAEDGRVLLGSKVVFPAPK